MSGSGTAYTVTGHVDLTVSSTLIAPVSAPARIAVAAGVRVGIYLGSSTVTLGGINAPGAVYSYATTMADPQDGSAETLTASGTPDIAFSISVEVEPDADNDGYGDQTQDLCPSQAATHGACVAPDTKITKGPSASTKGTVKYSFKSSDPTSTFECRLTGKGVHSKKLKQFKACRSPKTYKNLAPGHYTFFARADSAGVIDPSPAKVKLVVKAR